MDVQSSTAYSLNSYMCLKKYRLKPVAINFHFLVFVIEF